MFSVTANVREGGKEAEISMLILEKACILGILSSSLLLLFLNADWKPSKNGVCSGKWRMPGY